MPRSFYVSFGFCLFLIGQQVSTAVAQTTDDAGTWFAVFANGKHELFSEPGTESPYLWWFDAHYRLFDRTDGFGQSILRPGLGIKISENQALWAGYGWIHTSPERGNGIDEHRLWQQWTASPSHGNYRFLHRSRFEQRWVETGNDVGLRWRQLARAQRLFSESSKWSAIVWDEIFFNLNDTDWGANARSGSKPSVPGSGLSRVTALKISHRSWLLEPVHLPQRRSGSRQPHRLN